MSIKTKSSLFLQKLLPHTLIASLAFGTLFSVFPLIKNNYKVEADIKENHIKSERELDYNSDNQFSFFHENTVLPYSTIEVETKINSVVINNKEEIKASKSYKVLETIETTFTGYSSTVDQTNSNPFVTASGDWVRDGIVAANFLPFGTKIRIPNLFQDKVFIVKDRMNRRHNNRVDIWFSSRQQAINFGIKYSYIEIVEEI
jgi:3D (Asp-Asp-Asp) domain-containing protein